MSYERLVFISQVVKPHFPRENSEDEINYIHYKTALKIAENSRSVEAKMSFHSKIVPIFFSRLVEVLEFCYRKIKTLIDEIQ